MSKSPSAKYYQDKKEKLKKKACERYQNLSKEDKIKRRQYGRERHKNLLEDEIAKVGWVLKKYTKWEKMPYYNYKKLFSFIKSSFFLGLG